MTGLRTYFFRALCAVLIVVAAPLVARDAICAHPGFGGMSFGEPAAPDLVLPLGIRVHPRSGNLAMSVPLFYRSTYGVPVDIGLHYSHDRRHSASPYGAGWWLSVAARTTVGANGDIHIYWADGHHDVLKAPSYAPSATHADWQVGLSGGRLATIRTGGRIIWRFDASGLLDRVEDVSGAGVSVQYDGYGRVAAIVHDNGRRWSAAYSAERLASLTEDSTGRSWTFVYGAGGELQQIVDPAGRTHGFGWDVDNRLVSRTATDGRTVTVRWGPDGSSLVPDQVSQGGLVWQLSWDLTARQMTLTEPAGATWIHGFDAAGHVTGIADPYGNWTIVVPDAATGRPVAVTEPGGAALTISYDGRGRIVSSDYAGAGAVSFAYGLTDYDRPTEFVDAAGQIWRTAWSPSGLPVAVTDPLGNTQRITYDARGLPQRVTSAAARTTVLTWDTVGRLQAIDPGDGNVTMYGYDAADRMIAVTEPGGYTLRIEYDALDRPVRVTDSTGADLLRWYYDSAGDLTMTVDGGGHSTRRVYDATHRLVEVSDEAGHRERFLRDAWGHVTAYVDATGFMQRYDYDLMDRIVTETDTLGRQYVNVWDVRGQLVARQNGAGQALLQWQLDAQGYPVAVTWSDLLSRGLYGAVTMRYRRDARSQVTEVVEEDDGFGGTDRTRFWYDAAGRVTMATNWIRDATASLDHLTARYSYDGEGRLVSLQLPGGEWLGDTAGNQQAYFYDSAGRVTLTTTLATQDGVPRLETIATWYDAAGQITGTDTRADGQVVHQLRYFRDAGQRVTQVTEWVGPPSLRSWRSDTLYDYDASGRTTRTTLHYEPMATGDPFGYGTITSTTRMYYDAAGRMTAQVESRIDAQGSDGSFFVWQLDDAGRVISGLEGPNPTAAQPYVVTRNADGSVAEYWSAATGLTRFLYDAWGRVTAEVLPDQNTTIYYTYDAKSRLRQIAVFDGSGGAPPSQTLVYDALDRLVRIEVRNVTVGAFSTSVNFSHRYVYGSPRPVEVLVYDLYSIPPDYTRRKAVFGYDRPAQDRPTNLQSGVPPHRTGNFRTSTSWLETFDGGACLYGPGGCTGGFWDSLGGGSPEYLQWPSAPFSDPYANPYIEPVAPSAYDEERWAHWPLMQVPAGAAAQPGVVAVGGEPTRQDMRSGSVSLQGLTTGWEVGTDDPRFALSVDNCGGAVRHTRVPQQQVSSGIGRAGTPDVSGLGGVASSTGGFVDYVSRNGPGINYAMSAGNAGLFTAGKVVKTGGKVLSRVLGPVMTIVSGTMYYGNNRANGMSKTLSVLNGAGNAILDLGYTIPGVIDAGLYGLTGQDVGITTMFKTAFDAAFVCSTKGLDFFVDQMRNGKRGWFSQRMANFYYNLGDSDLGGKIYQHAEDALTTIGSGAKKAYRTVLGGARSAVNAVRNSAPVRAVSNFLGRLFGGAR